MATSYLGKATSAAYCTNYPTLVRVLHNPKKGGLHNASMPFIYIRYLRYYMYLVNYCMNQQRSGIIAVVKNTCNLSGGWAGAACTNQVICTVSAASGFSTAVARIFPSRFPLLICANTTSISLPT